MLDLRIRSARAGEVDALTALCVQSKAYWGYGADFMKRSAVALAVTPSMIEEGRVLVAEDRHANPVGVAAIERLGGDGKFDLARLFVLPSAMRAGVGRALFEAAVKLAEIEGGTSLLILSDPFAEAFYARLGAVKIGEGPSDAIPGRLLPLLEYAIPHRRMSG
ncbi:MAG TPA: GNAT family N-acetyltransferase [Alphaproteobacteria bacterium]